MKMGVFGVRSNSLNIDWSFSMGSHSPQYKCFVILGDVEPCLGGCGMNLLWIFIIIVGIAVLFILNTSGPYPNLFTGKTILPKIQMPYNLQYESQN